MRQKLWSWLRREWRTQHANNPWLYWSFLSSLVPCLWLSLDSPWICLALSFIMMFLLSCMMHQNQQLLLICRDNSYCLEQTWIWMEQEESLFFSSIFSEGSASEFVSFANFLISFSVSLFNSRWRFRHYACVWCSFPFLPVSSFSFHASEFFTWLKTLRSCLMLLPNLVLYACFVQNSKLSPPKIDHQPQLLLIHSCLPQLSLCIHCVSQTCSK